MKLIKRNGSETVFDREKIIAAITKANGAVDEDDKITTEKIAEVALTVENKCLRMMRAVTVEEVQDLVERALMELCAYKLAKAYITYRYRRALFLMITYIRLRNWK